MAGGSALAPLAPAATLPATPIHAPAELAGGSVVPSPARPAGGSSSYWIDLTSSAGSAPSSRAFAGFTWDASASEFILYGGEDGTGTDSDTWAYTIAGGWKDLKPSSNPGGLAEPAMAYDSTDSEVVINGGCSGLFSCPTSGTYVFSQGDWTQYTTGSEPPADLAAGMSDNPPGGDVIMFGGCDSFSITNEDCNSGGFLDTTWAFTAAAGWKQVTTGPSPPAREAPFMTYDPAIGGILMFGGYNGVNGLTDTWEFKGGNWFQLNPATNCALEANGGMFYDAALNAAIAYGGDTPNGETQETWEFSNGNWTQLFPPLAPAPRDGVDAASSDTGIPIVWGGETNGSTLQQDTWAFDPLSAPTTVSPTATDVGQPVSFSSLISGGDPPLSIGWAFGDGTTATVANTTHTYTSPCTCNAVFSVKDALGQTAGGTTVVNISALPTITAAENDSSAITGVPMQFWGNATGGTAPVNITWTFGDGTTGYGPKPLHAYSIPGTKTIDVSVTDGIGKTASATLTMTVKAPPGALLVSVSATPTSGTAPLTVAFTSTVTGGTGGDTYSWSFGDASTSTVANTSHTYAHPGSFAANLTVTDSKGTTGASSATISVSAPPLGLSIVATPTSGLAPLAIVFSAAPTGGVAPYSYNWTFGDGPEYSHAASPTHVYNDTTTGWFNDTVHLALLDDETPHLSIARELNVTVEPTPPLVATLHYLSNPAPNTTATYSASATGGIPWTSGYRFVWSFGDHSANVTTNGTNSTTHEYTAPGVYHLSVVVIDSLGHNVTVTGTVNVGASAALAAGGAGVLIFSGPNWWLFLIVPIATVAMLAAAVFLIGTDHRRHERSPEAPAPPPAAQYAEPSYYPTLGWR